MPGNDNSISDVDHEKPVESNVLESAIPTDSEKSTADSKKSVASSAARGALHNTSTGLGSAKDVPFQAQKEDNGYNVQKDGRSTLNPALNLLVDDKHCNVCKSDIDIKTHGIQCNKCDCWFHAINCSDEKWNVSSPTSFTGHILPAVRNTGVWEKRFGTFSFMCDHCSNKQNVSDVATMKDRVEMLENKIDCMRMDFKNELKELKNLLTSRATIDTATPTTPTSVSSLLDTSPLATKKAPPAPVSSTVSHGVDTYAQVLKINKDTQGKSISHETLEKACIENGISVTNTFNMKKDSATGIIVNSKKDADALHKVLEVVSPDHKLQKVPTRVPTITVVGLSRRYESSELSTMIQKQNYGIAAIFDDDNPNPEDLLLDIRSISPLKNNDAIFKATIRVSNAIRAVIGKQGMRLYIGTQTTCKVYDHVFVLRCYKCQEYGHHNDDCGNVSVCGHCAKEGHQTRDCNVADDPRKKRCINCHQAGCRDSRHAANDLNCPIFLENQARVKKMVPFHQRKN